MYLYIPTDGRSIAIGEYIISATGLQVDDLIKCLEAQIGKQLKRETIEILPIPVLEPQVTETEIPTMPQTEK